MNTYKWDKMKEKAIANYFGVDKHDFAFRWHQLVPYGLIAGAADGSFDWKKNLEEMRNQAIQLIEKWDIRRVKTLIELFPTIVSVKDGNRMPFVDIDEKGDWVVSFETGVANEDR